MTVPQGESQGLEASDVSGEFKYSENSQDSEDLSSLGHPLQRVLGVEEVEQDWDEEGEDPEQVDDVQKVREELNLHKVMLFQILFVDVWWW